MHKTQVFHFRLKSELSLAPIYQVFLSSMEQVINIENQDQRLDLYNLEVQVSVSLALRVAQPLNIYFNPKIPSIGGLLKPI